jgi:hypothetical protein
MDLGAVSGIPALDAQEMTQAFDLRNPETDQTIHSESVTVYEAFRVIYSVVRGWQLKRDQAQEAQP